MKRRSDATPANPFQDDPEPAPVPVITVPAAVPSTLDQFLGSGKEVPLSSDFEKIVTKIFVEEPDKVFDRLERILKLGDTRDDRGSVLKALDEAEDNARLAHKLWSTAQRERVRWEKDNEVIHGAMRLEATKVLQQEKAGGVRSKQITDADVEAMCATLFPDEYRAQEVRRASVKAMEDSIKNLAELWGKRISSLQTMLSKQR